MTDHTDELMSALYKALYEGEMSVFYLVHRVADVARLAVTRKAGAGVYETIEARAIDEHNLDVLLDARGKMY